MRSWDRGRPSPKPRALAPALAVGLLVCGWTSAATAAGAAAASAPVVSSVSTSSDSWVIVPMGDLSESSNTFWELFHGVPGSPHWSLVTPPGVADNGGLVEGASDGAVLVGVLPSDLLRFSPLAQSGDGGSSWKPAFLPAGLAPLPDAIAYEAALPGRAIALTGGGRVVSAPRSFSSWSPLVSATGLRRLSPGCAVTEPDAVAVMPTGAPVIATGCRRGGQVGVFTQTMGSWLPIGDTLGGSLRGPATTVLRLEVTGSTTTALVSARRAGRRALVALWRTGSAPWAGSAPLAVGSGTSVLSTSVGAGGALAVLLRSPGGSRVAFDTAPSGRTWSPLPRLPLRTSALALPATPMTLDAEAVDAFTVDGGSLGVYALSPSGSNWVKVQTSQVPIAYGSSG